MTPPSAAELFGDGYDREIAEFRAANALDTPPERPIITLVPGEAPEAVDQAERLLVARASELRIYQRAGEVVRIVALDAEQTAGPIRKPAGTVQLAPVSAVALTEEFDRVAAWERLRQGRDGPESRRVDCPARIAAAYLARIGAWRLPVLAGVIAAPIMRGDGTILRSAGYDAATGLYLAGNGWPTIPSAPTGLDAHHALAVLVAPFAEFPFVEPEDRSVLLAAILTALQRRLLPAAPMFGFSAPAKRTGKSLLAEAVGIIATGQPAPAMAVSSDREETRKAVVSILREGHSIVNLDNMDHPLGSADLARAITQGEYADRLLGESKLLLLPTNLTWLATGNNLAFRGDLAVRALLCRLDAQAERPEERSFTIANLKAHIAAHRAELIAAALTILRAYHVAGRPAQNLPPWGGFEEWSGLIRSALVWLGEADPCASRQHVIEDDPDREQAEALLTAWHRAFESRAVQISEAIDRAKNDQDLLGAIVSVAPAKADPRQPDARRLGWWCRENANRIIGGLRLSRATGERRSGALWRVAPPVGRREVEVSEVSEVFEVFLGQQKTDQAAHERGINFDGEEKTSKTSKTSADPGHKRGEA
ncbi:MAG TPA: hypothetical protein VE996_04525 [Terriglobales bacterium]|nr:hypothetical protein [Terriglobales bacterium]